MYWKVDVLTKTGKEITLKRNGRKDKITLDLCAEDLTLIAMTPDIRSTLNEVFISGTLSNSKLSSLFIDFSRMLQSGLSLSETTKCLSDITLNDQIKRGLAKFRNSINEGLSLKESIETAGIFPKIVSLSLEAAEKSGQIAEISRKLAEYFKYMNETANKIIGSFIYPVLVFMALTAACAVISMKLVPQLGFLIPENQRASLSFRIVIGYAGFIKSYWWLLIMGLAAAVISGWYLWCQHKERISPYLFKVPVLGNTLKEMELADIFLHLFIYIKSGISITEALGNIYSSRNNYITHKLAAITNRINAGFTLAESFGKDSFFPSFIQQSLKKGEETGKLVEYVYETHKYYEGKSRESIATVVKLINPALMCLAFAFAGFIASFYILIYQKMGEMGAGIYQ